MCFIYGVFNSQMHSLSSVYNRGKDGAGYISDVSKGFYKNPKNLKPKYKKFLFVHFLHSVVGHQKQPFKDKGIFITNCEIYNWRELSKKYSFNAKNDAHLFFLLIEKKGLNSLAEIDGVYSFAYFKDNKLYLGRDILGVRPLFYKKEKKAFSFASENKVIDGRELNPRQILVYDFSKNKISFKKRNFFKKTKNIKDRKKAKQIIEKTLRKAISKRIPSVKYGVLLSGGIDSSLLAYFSQSRNNYFVMVENKAKDLPNISFLEKKGVKIKKIAINKKDIKKAIPLVVQTIESADPVKVSVGLVNYFACRKAKKDRVKVLFSGLGADELFGGYNRFSQKNTEKEIISYLFRLYENDLYRDDTISMLNNIELRLPYLDYSLIQAVLNLDSSLLLDNTERKIILRDIYQDIFGNRGPLKKSSQYGSGIMPVLKEIAKDNGKTIGSYLSSFLKKRKKLALLMSSGKDSMYAMQVMKSRNYDICCLVSIIPENPDSYMYQKPVLKVISAQAKALNLPLIKVKTKGEKETELLALKKGMALAKKKGAEGVITGATYSNYQRERIEKTAQMIGLQVYSPLWQINQISLLKNLVRFGFKVIIFKISAFPLTEKHLGRILDSSLISELQDIADKYPGFNPAGEGGEYESIVLDCPLFSKQLEIKFSKKMLSENTGFLEIKKVALKNKNLN